MKKIITAMIRLRLEYAALIWSPHRKINKEPGNDTEDSGQSGTGVIESAM